MTANITRDEWLVALNTAQELRNDPDVYSCLELAKLLGMSRRRMEEKLPDAIAEGRVLRTTKVVVNAAGQRRVVSGYKLVK